MLHDAELCALIAIELYGTYQSRSDHKKHLTGPYRPGKLKVVCITVPIYIQDPELLPCFPEYPDTVDLIVQPMPTCLNHTARQSSL